MSSAGHEAASRGGDDGATLVMDGNGDPLRTGLLNVLAQIEQGRGRKACQTIHVLGCHRGAGGTTIGLALAEVALEAGLGPVLIVEANAQAPALAERLGRAPPPDLGQVVEAGSGWRSAVADAPGAGPALAVLGPQPFRLVGRADFRVAWDLVRQAFRLILLDSCSLDESPAMATLPHALDAQVVLVATEETTATQARRVRDALVRAQAPILGVILNKRVAPLPPMLDRLV